MLVFTLTNNVTDEVWVGTCKDSCEERFTQLKEAMTLGIKSPIYKDLRDYGAKNFSVDDFAMAQDREELVELFSEAMETYEGKSLQGVKTSLRSAAAVKVVPSRARSAMASRSPVAKAKPKVTKEKISSGRTNNSAKEKLMKERLAEEKAERDMEKRRLEREQADEMAKIIARLDARGSSLAKR
ncbi:MAG: hypothetical protein COB04_02215 [Gammaproteobacteria bacterium]|nr:MAG: hypothetical protein COB04_02215 [Gammaproteobacteria bacterium]